MAWTIDTKFVLYVVKTSLWPLIRRDLITLFLDRVHLLTQKNEHIISRVKYHDSRQHTKSNEQDIWNPHQQRDDYTPSCLLWHVWISPLRNRVRLPCPTDTVRILEKIRSVSGVLSCWRKDSKILEQSSTVLNKPNGRALLVWGACVQRLLAMSQYGRFGGVCQTRWYCKLWFCHRLVNSRHIYNNRRR